jgi:lipopolysaccharide biosynthesis regulator YciM
LNFTFIDYSDPLFGIILFVALIALISTVHYFISIIQQKRERRHLRSFLKKFQLGMNDEHIRNFVENEHIPLSAVNLLASAYYEHGEYEKSIEIYQLSLERTHASHDRRDLLLQLAQAYFKAGFLQRTKETLLEILRYFPRTPEALHLLTVVYEQLHDYKGALSTLEPLSELNHKMSETKTYFKLLNTIHDPKQSSEEKITFLKTFYAKEEKFHRLIFEYLANHAPYEVLHLYREEHFDQLIDILWQIDLKYFTHAPKTPKIEELISARGGKLTLSNHFEFSVLTHLHTTNTKATLQFEYLCTSCKEVLPLSFHRCPNCFSLDTITCEYSLAKQYDETNNSFQ